MSPHDRHPDSQPDDARPMSLVVGYDPAVLALVPLVGAGAAYTGFEMGRCAAVARGRARLAWLAAGAVGMGSGTWAAALLAMLGWRLSTPVTYGFEVLIPALVWAIAASGAALLVAGLSAPTAIRLPIAGALLLLALIGGHGALLIPLHTGSATTFDALAKHFAGLGAGGLAVAALGCLAAVALAYHVPPAAGRASRWSVLAAVAFAAGLVGIQMIGLSPGSPMAAPASGGVAATFGPSALASLIVVGSALLLSAALAGARAQRRLSAHASALLAGADVAREISRRPDARAAVCEAACRLNGAPFSELYEPDGEGFLVMTATWGRQLPPARIRIGGEPSGAAAAFTSKTRLLACDASRHPLISQRLATQSGNASALFELILRDGEAVGVLVVCWSQRVREIPERAVLVTELLTAQAAIAIERADLVARLSALAGTDALTGLPNRRTLEAELPRELALAAREDRRLRLGGAGRADRDVPRPRPGRRPAPEA